MLLKGKKQEDALEKKMDGERKMARRYTFNEKRGWLIWTDSQVSAAGGGREKGGRDCPKNFKWKHCAGEGESDRGTLTKNETSNRVHWFS